MGFKQQSLLDYRIVEELVQKRLERKQSPALLQIKDVN